MHNLTRLLRTLSLLSLLSLLLVACGGSTSTTTSSSSPSSSTPATAPVTLNVFAAASLTESFNAIATSYKQTHPNVNIVFNFNGSQLLEQQIANGAPADIFASADLANMQKASSAGLVDESQIFAKNKLVVIVPASNPGTIMTLHDLANKGIKIDIGAPAVPAGKYALQVLTNMAASPDYGPSYKSAVLGNIVSQEDNVKAVITKVQLGEADAGFVYQTDVTSAVASKLIVIPIPDNFNVIAEYPIAVVKNSAHASDAQAFVQYILSSDGQAILAKFHFLSITS
jgi:molybdate transport system substrate-binding protein